MKNLFKGNLFARKSVTGDEDYNGEKEPETRKKRDRSEKKIIHIMVFLGCLFLILVIYLSWFEIAVSDKIVTNTYNRRQWALEENTVRGQILDKNGVVLARDEGEGKSRHRVYPYKQLYCHVIGYNSRSYGKSLLELHYNRELLGAGSIESFFGLGSRITGEVRYGYNLHLTVDHNLQNLADRLLGNRRGAVVALNPRTGEILALVSKPGFDPSEESLSKNWQSLVEAKDSPFLPRATMGLYAPGSTFKILVAGAAVENNLGGRTFEDRGQVIIDGKPFKNTGGVAHGKIGLSRALEVSSNVVFAQIGVELGFRKLKDMALRAGFEKKIDFDFPVAKSRFPYNDMGKSDMAASAIGQGKIQVTPLHMALITGAVANGGVMMRPYIVDKITDKNGKTIKDFGSQAFIRMMDDETANAVASMMENVVKKGTGGNASIKGVRVAGKTGTAENELTSRQKNSEHAWFVGFAPVENPRIAVAVILEYSGSTGGAVAAPIAGKIMEQYLKTRQNE